MSDNTFDHDLLPPFCSCCGETLNYGDKCDNCAILALNIDLDYDREEE